MLISRAFAFLGAFLGAVAALTVAAPPAAADQADGKQLYLTRTCVACHGKGGAKAIQSYPHLAGLPEAYLYEQMTDIAAGTRMSGPDARGYPRTQAMKDVMGVVTDDELKIIAAWLAMQPPPPVVPADPAKIAKGADAYKAANCETCHGEKGSKPLEGFPIIAGQKKEYLLLQIKEIRTGVRTNGNATVMAAAIAQLNDDDAEAIAEYLASTERPASQGNGGLR